MFTGLIEEIGIVRGLDREGEGGKLTIGTKIPFSELVLGESIAVNGACLTVTSFGAGFFTADLSPETLGRSTLGSLRPGSRVNLERALRLSDRLGGHLVTGHVDGVGTVTERRRDGNALRFAFRLDPQLTLLLVEKGSVAVEGISLTVNEVGSDFFSVAVIPHTLAATTLQEAEIGTRVNIETDLLAKYVQRLLKGGSGQIEKGLLDREFLAKHGFL